MQRRLSSTERLIQVVIGNAALLMQQTRLQQERETAEGLARAAEHLAHIYELQRAISSLQTRRN